MSDIHARPRQLEYGEHDMEFDNLHTVENFTDIYDNPAEMVVYESVSNSIDANANNVNIITRTDSGEYSISFLDNGPGMDTQQFADYQVGSRSTKDKKFGLGFAGIGAKLYVIAHEKSEIITETGKDTVSPTQPSTSVSTTYIFKLPELIHSKSNLAKS